MPRIIEEETIIVQGGGGGGTSAFVEALTFKMSFADSSSTPTEQATFNMTLTETESTSTPTESLTLKLPSPDFTDSSSTPTESNSFTMRVWLSGSAVSNDFGTSDAVGSASNADGQNNGTVATITTAVAGNARCTMKSVLGANIPAGVSIASAIYRGWFKSVNTLVTSVTNVTLHSSTALFADQIIFTNSGLNMTVDHSTGDFTYDLIANGINTLAKLQSLQVYHRTTDAVSGVTPAVLTVDAGSIELAGAF